jgi:hypothetical protein
MLKLNDSKPKITGFLDSIPNSNYYRLKFRRGNGEIREIYGILTDTWVNLKFWTSKFPKMAIFIIFHVEPTERGAQWYHPRAYFRTARY